MADLERAREDLGVFAELVGCELADWQVAALTLETRTTVIVGSRQCGKSRSLAVLALWWAFRKPNQRVLIVSSGDDGARRLLAEARRIAVGSQLLAGSVVDESGGLLTLSNGSEVRSVAASERAIRGWTVDLLLVDEAALVGDDLLLGAALPTTTARPDARIVLAAAANVNQGAFYDSAMRGEQGSEHTRTFYWWLKDCDWVSASAEASLRESMSELRAGAELDNVFAGGADALFPRRILENVTVDFIPDALESMAGPARVMVGNDWGASSDLSTMVALARVPVAFDADGPDRGVVLGVRMANAWPAGYPLPRVVAEIAGSPAAYDVVSAERNGLGEPCCQMLWSALARRSYFAGGAPPRPQYFVINDFESREETAVRARRFRRPAGVFRTEKNGVHTTAAVKSAMYSQLRLLVDRERLLISSSSTDLLRELLLLRVQLSPQGSEAIDASSGHDDLADALALSQGPYKAQDGRIHTVVGDLLRPGMPTSPTAGPGGDWVEGPGSMRVARRPAWLSVRGVDRLGSDDAGVNVEPRDVMVAAN